MKYTERLGNNAVVPVVVLDDVCNAVPTANALLAGGIDVMEITLRTAAAMDSIKTVCANCPDMLVGAGTVINVEQAKTVVEAGAKFIVSPGFDEELVRWCLDNDVTVVPGCITPTEIMAALKLGVNVIKFFPANVFGGLNAMKNLSAPFGNVKFVPTGGVNGQNIGEYVAAPFIHTVGGSWVCTKNDIAAGNFDKITALCKEAVTNALGFELAHIGVNADNEEIAQETAGQFNAVLGSGIKDGNSSVFVGTGFEIMKAPYLGNNGHLAIRTNHIGRAIAFLNKKGFSVDMETAKYKGNKMIAVYLTGEIGGFAIHLLQK